MRILRAIFGHPQRPHRRAIIVGVYLLIAILGALGLTPHNPLTQFRDRPAASARAAPTGWAPTCSAATSPAG